MPTSVTRNVPQANIPSGPTTTTQPSAASSKSQRQSNQSTASQQAFPTADTARTTFGAANSSAPQASSSSSRSAESSATAYAYSSANSSHGGGGSGGGCVHERGGAPCKWRAMPGDQRVLLEDVEDEATLSCLSSRQLKDMLAFNYVNYRDCLERGELVERAVWLWRNKQRAKSRDASGQSASAKASVGGGGTCAICMDAEADAVFLDCGHLVACTECGRRLAECPICRRNIIRVVKVFKS